MSDHEAFHYRPSCSVRGCVEPASFKIAAAWSDGTSRELKNYGTVCAAHRAEELARARARRQGLKLAEGEAVGEVGLFQLVPGKHDRELPRLPE
jgi:hypothetical protein